MAESEFSEHQKQCEKLFDAKLESICNRIEGLEKLSEFNRSAIKEQIKDILTERDNRYQQRFGGQDLAVKAALESAQLAVDKAETNTTKWQDNANEWRAAMSDKDKLLATKQEVASMQKELDDLKTFRDVATGKASLTSVMVAYVMAGASLLINLVQLLIKSLTK